MYRELQIRLDQDLANVHVIPLSQMQLCGYYPHYLVVKSERDQSNLHLFDAAIIRIIATSGPDFGFVNAIPK